ncbi:MAG: hypothetical protein JWO08_3911 [Verrucomicrobiaceae bacterium]|nr:hypothetical protein [Verrucomicrobiaceae bacterium]
MKLRLFVSCWGNEVDIAGAIELAHHWQADGIEGPPPDAGQGEALRKSGLLWIAEVPTGGGYVPKPHLKPTRHLDDLRRLIEASLPFAPVLVNALAGSDAWAFRDKVQFFSQAMEMGKALNVHLAFETHRSRPTFNPWVTRDLLLELPEMRVTCDFSHWCAVCERLVMDEEPELLDLLAERVAHVHARVGYDQGPQVPDPRAPEHADALVAHVRWWRRLALGKSALTMTAEFGPDGYLQRAPFSQRPVADLRQINGWMTGHLRNVMTGVNSSYD